MKYSRGHLAIPMGHNYVLFGPSRNKQEQHERRSILNALVIKKNKNVHIIVLLLNRTNNINIFKYRLNTSLI